jgi:hypothetical protein
MNAPGWLMFLIAILVILAILVLLGFHPHI